ncbi:MAG: peptidylprolyl isomerase, partial [Armatimonadota bacterium]
MSLMGMKRFVEKFGVAVVALLALPLLIGIVYSGIGRNLGGGGGRSMVSAGDEGTPVARVGERTIGRARLDDLVARQSRMGQAPAPAPELMDMFRLMVLDQFKGQEAVLEAGRKAGVTVGDDELASAGAKEWDASGRASVAGQLGLAATASDSDIEAALRKVDASLTIDGVKERMADPERLRLSLTYEKLRSREAASINVAADLVKRSYSDIRVRHILIKSGEGGLPDDQAWAKADKVLAEVLKDPAKMPALAKQYSDDPGSKDKGGIYEWQTGQSYVPEFTEGALAAGVGKVNPKPIRTSYGYHIIKLEGERPGKLLPKDWDKEQAKYVKQYVERIAGGKAGDQIKAAESSVRIELLDPGLRAAKLVRDAGPSDRNAKLSEAIAELDKIPASDDPLGAVPLRKAALYETLGKTKEAVAAYESALEGRNLPETRFKLAEALRKSGDKDAVSAQIVQIRKLPLTTPEQWKQLADLYRSVGDKAGEREALEKNQAMVQRRR